MKTLSELIATIWELRDKPTEKRNYHTWQEIADEIWPGLSRSIVWRIAKARYHPKNPDKKVLGEPRVRKLNREEREKLRKLDEQIAA